MGELANEILEISMEYFKVMDKDVDEDFVLLFIQSVMDEYKTLRNYPDDFTDEMIEADVVQYFSRRKNNVAMKLVPELFGRAGGEGLAMMVDAGTTRYWVQTNLLSDVTPYCEVI